MYYSTDQSVYYLKAGGIHDKLKADWEGQRFTHLRQLALLRENHTRNAEEQLKDLLKGKRACSSQDKDSMYVRWQQAGMPEGKLPILV